MTIEPLLPKHLLPELVALIEAGQQQVAINVNSTLLLVYWQVGKRINEEILNNERATYGKQVVASVAEELTQKFGNTFQLRNLRRMMQFAQVFPDLEIVTPLATHLSWSHFILIFPLDSLEEQLFYAQQAIASNWGKRELKHQIDRKAYERTAIADSQLPSGEHTMKSVFKDPYFLDFLGLKDGYLENDLEAAIIKELELFILELGIGFTFVERQKRMIIDGKDHHLDLLFYHRKLRRLVAVELKIDEFKAKYKGQMELYLKWLEKHDQESGEEPPIGLILCTKAGKETVELLDPHKDGIMVAGYWTDLPSKSLLEEKLHQAFIEAQERLMSKKMRL
ncbi:MAG: putative nuclease of restriction endonuclease-like (RecB) superfamily [Saprospiraceae bacterium]|jgi:predicted nuclease of restriction endonuclease-like (RecB) superfamily